MITYQNVLVIIQYEIEIIHSYHLNVVNHIINYQNILVKGRVCTKIFPNYIWYILHHNIMALKKCMITYQNVLVIIQYENQIVPLIHDEIITKTFSNVNKQLT